MSSYTYCGYGNCYDCADVYPCRWDNSGYCYNYLSDTSYHSDYESSSYYCSDCCNQYYSCDDCTTDYCSSTLDCVWDNTYSSCVDYYSEYPYDYESYSWNCDDDYYYSSSTTTASSAISAIVWVFILGGYCFCCCIAYIIYYQNQQRRRRVVTTTTVASTTTVAKPVQARQPQAGVIMSSPTMGANPNIKYVDQNGMYHPS